MHNRAAELQGSRILAEVALSSIPTYVTCCALVGQQVYEEDAEEVEEAEAAEQEGGGKEELKPFHAHGTVAGAKAGPSGRGGADDEDDGAEYSGGWTLRKAR